VDVGQVVSRSARRFAGRVAVEGPDRTLTFAQLGDRVTRLANGLRALGLQDGDRVLDLQTNSTTYLETDLAIRSAGLVRVALNHRLHPSDWARIADDSGAAAMVYDGRFAAQTEELRHGLGGKRVVVAGDGPGLSYDTLLADASTTPLAPVDADVLCGLHYSSGTTGHPKGAQRTHRNWLASLVNMTVDVIGAPPGPGDVYAHAGPITHTSGLFVPPHSVRWPVTQNYWRASAPGFGTFSWMTRSTLIRWQPSLCG
jgi:acyl-CoA synthetase (AMP-forming)/AMP-acid ligase II